MRATMGKIIQEGQTMEINFDLQLFGGFISNLFGGGGGGSSSPAPASPAVAASAPGSTAKQTANPDENAQIAAQKLRRYRMSRSETNVTQGALSGAAESATGAIAKRLLGN